MQLGTRKKCVMGPLSLALTKIDAYYWEKPFLFKYCADQIIRKCVPEEEQQGILSHCHGMHVEATLPLIKQP